MDKNKAKAAIEAILFTMGESVEISRLAAVMEMDKQEVTALLKRNGQGLPEGKQRYFSHVVRGQRAALHQSGFV